MSRPRSTLRDRRPGAIFFDHRKIVTVTVFGAASAVVIDAMGLSLFDLLAIDPSAGGAAMAALRHGADPDRTQ